MVGAKIRHLFFDSPAVLKATDRATRKVLSKFGAFVRTAARSSIRKRKAPAPPGAPPSSHLGLLRKFIFFGYEPQRRNVIIGPERLGQKLGDAPHALEHGGTSRVTGADRRKRRVVRTVRIEARPFMGPAFEKEKPKLPALWANSIK